MESEKFHNNKEGKESLSTKRDPLHELLKGTLLWRIKSMSITVLRRVYIKCAVLVKIIGLVI